MVNFLKKLVAKPGSRGFQSPNTILKTFDAAAADFTFPMLDNGYVYLAATRPSLFRSEKDWTLVFEVFGFSPRTGYPDITTTTLASCIHNRRRREDYATEEAFQRYLHANRHVEQSTFHPIENDSWIDSENLELTALSGTISLRGQTLPLPAVEAYAQNNIPLEADRPAVHELCRLLAATHREDVLASPEKRRQHVQPEMKILTTLDDWHHPDIVKGELPSATDTFQQIA